jgi:reactive intermediate/imine deaminase
VAGERIRPVQSAQVAAPTVPYSQALVVEAGRLLFIAGQGPVDAAGNLVGAGDVEAQVRQVFANVRALLEAAGGRLDHLVELTIYLRDMRHRPAVTRVREELLRPPYPTATMVEISRLAFDDWLVEISAIAAL